MDRSRNPPLPPPPKGWATGILAVILLAAVLPILALMAAGGWTGEGDELWLRHLPWLVIAPLSAITIPPLLAPYRRIWTVRAYRALGTLVAVAYPAVLLLAAAIPLGLVRQRSAEAFYTVVYPLGFLLALLPLYWLLLRYLRLPYAPSEAAGSKEKR